VGGLALGSRGPRYTAGGVGALFPVTRCVLLTRKWLRLIRVLFFLGVYLIYFSPSTTVHHHRRQFSFSTSYAKLSTHRSEFSFPLALPVPVFIDVLPYWWEFLFSGGTAIYYTHSRCLFPWRAVLSSPRLLWGRLG